MVLGEEDPTPAVCGAEPRSRNHCGPSPGCYPFYKTDPFIFPECPHVYFCGNTPSFGSKIFRGKSFLLGASGLGCHERAGLAEKAALESPGPVWLGSLPGGPLAEWGLKRPTRVQWCSRLPRSAWL